MECVYCTVALREYFEPVVECSSGPRRVLAQASGLKLLLRRCGKRHGVSVHRRWSFYCTEADQIKLIVLTGDQESKLVRQAGS